MNERQTAWVIETAQGEYWNGRAVGHDARSAFVKDIDEALRFARKEDAEIVRCWLFGMPGQGLGWALRSMEHIWLGDDEGPSPASVERERNAKVCDRLADMWDDMAGRNEAIAVRLAAEAIRNQPDAAPTLSALAAREEGK